MKKFLPLLLILVSCGPSDYFYSPTEEAPAPTPVPAPSVLPEPSILNKWIETASSSVISQPDFSALKLNTTGDANLTMGCTGSYGNNIVVNTLTSGQIRIQGTSIDGIVQFGNVQYYGMDYTTTAGLNCKNVSKEQYLYFIRNQILTLCLTNLSYPFCSTYNLAQ